MHVSISLFSVYEIKKIFKGGIHGLDWNDEINQGIKLEHWMVVSILTPCIVALYLILIMVAYHTFCKKDDCTADTTLHQGGQIEVCN